MNWLLAGLLAGAAIAVVGVPIIGTGGLAAVAIVGAGAAGGAGLGEAMSTMSWAPKEVTGLIAGICSLNVFTNARPAARAHLDMIVCSKHAGPPIPIASGGGQVYINGMPAARVDDKTGCGGVITKGSGNVFIGGGTVQTDNINPENLVPGWVHAALLVVGIGAAVVLAGPVIAVGGLVLGFAGGYGGSWAGGKIFGEGSDGQKWSAIGGSVLGGMLGAKWGPGAWNLVKGGQISTLRSTSPLTIGLETTKPAPRLIDSRRSYLNEKFARTGNLDLDINIRGRQEVATNFFRSQGVIDSDIPSYLTGIDFTQPVNVQSFGSGKSLWQFQTPGAPQGNWYSLSPNVHPSELGISPLGFNRATQTVEPKVLNGYTTAQPVRMLRSNSAAVEDFWSVKGQSHPTVGGARQLFSNQKSSFDGSTK